MFFSQLPKTAKATQTKQNTHIFRINQIIKRINIFDFFDYLNIFLSASKDWKGNKKEKDISELIK